MGQQGQTSLGFAGYAESGCRAARRSGIPRPSPPPRGPTCSYEAAGIFATTQRQDVFTAVACVHVHVPYHTTHLCSV